MSSSSRRRGVALATIVAPMALAVPATAVASDASSDAHGPVVTSSGSLRDLDLAAPGPFDDADALLRIVATGSGSHAVLRVHGVGAEADRLTYGAHLHVGPCVTGDGLAAGDHYNTDVLAGLTPAEVSGSTEMWLDITVRAGRAVATTSVPFVPSPGARAVVIHALGTDPATGKAGARLACLPVEW